MSNKNEALKILANIKPHTETPYSNTKTQTQLTYKVPPTTFHLKSYSL